MHFYPHLHKHKHITCSPARSHSHFQEKTSSGMCFNSHHHGPSERNVTPFSLGRYGSPGAFH